LLVQLLLLLPEVAVCHWLLLLAPAQLLCRLLLQQVQLLTSTVLLAWPGYLYQQSKFYCYK
jgi:hypothetical protein